jgi:hypothetical protein
MMNVYVPGTAQLMKAVPGSTPVALGGSGAATWSGGLPPEHLEMGKTVWSAAFEIGPGKSTSFRYDYRVPGVVRTVDGRRVYRLVVQHQPKVNPERLVVHIRLPEGASAVTARGFRRDGDMLVLDRIVKVDFELEVSWHE